MKYAVLGDIHSNLTALQAVLADLENRGGADEKWCLGDIVGYGPDPHECLEIVRTSFSLCVAGNHDLAVIGKVGIWDFNKDAAIAVRWTNLQLDKDEVAFLAGLPLKLEKDDFTLVHGSPREPVWEYLLSEPSSEENLKYFTTRHCLVGHTHRAIYFKCGASCEAGWPESDTKLSLTDCRYIINPGGVGQPRDNDPRAAYVLIDSQSSVIYFRRVSYDIKAVQNRMEKVGLPRWLIDRLSLGR